jgi:hypothetical protein
MIMADEDAVQEGAMRNASAAALKQHADVHPLEKFRVPLSEVELEELRQDWAEYLLPVAQAARNASELPPDLAPLIQYLGRRYRWQLPSMD